MNIEELKKEYAEQDNRCTAYPIYVQVQELICIGVMEDGYSPYCPYGDGETKDEYKHDCYEGTSFDEQDVIDHIKEYFSGEEDKIEEEISNIERIQTGWLWHPVEFFLTIKGANEYIISNKHNHGKLRTYVSHFESRNFEMRNLLTELGFKTKD